MTVVARIWVPSAAVVPQERGPAFLGVVDGAEWSEGGGFHRGFFSAFRIKAGKEVWFHFPLPVPVEQDGKPLHLTEISLLWECLDDARIGWMCVQHGGMERVALSERLVEPPAHSVPHAPPGQWAQYHPQGFRRLTEVPLDPPLPLKFGVQLCVMIRAPGQDGTVRFYGAGAAVSRLD